ncbi:MAG: hypothetical protein ACRDZO_18795 [Egibacteraceae bacterium]
MTTLIDADGFAGSAPCPIDAACRAERRWAPVDIDKLALQVATVVLVQHEAESQRGDDGLAGGR